ncbi:MAG: SMP-30/gluconolactonase/LRE family protein [Bacillota bacterium]|nr:SMP-30/gluconolactonase/LRE family protein [Bacillota bacterium]
MHRTFRALILFIVLVNILTACSSEGTKQNKSSNNNQQATATTGLNKEETTQKERNTDTSYLAEVFADLGGASTGGIAFDDGVMYVAKEGKEILKVMPDGSFSTLCSIRDLPKGDIKSDPHMSFESPFIWDMVIGKDRNIYAAAADRILKISMDGKVTTLIKDNFGGLFGASGIDIDNNGNIYVTDGCNINKYTRLLQKLVFIDGTKIQIDDSNPLTYAFSLKFDPDCKNLYVGNRGPDGILKFPINSDGTPGKASIITQKTVTCPHTLAFDTNGNIYACPGHSGVVLFCDQGGKQKFYIANTEIDNATFAFGNKSFGENTLYITSLTSGKVYKYDLNNKNLKIQDDFSLE